MTLDVQAVESDAVDGVRRRITGTAESEDVDGPATGDERLGLPADPRILLVVGVDDHADRSTIGRNRHETRRGASIGRRQRP